MNLRKRSALVLIVAGVGVSILCACGRQQNKTQPEAETNLPPKPSAAVNRQGDDTTTAFDLGGPCLPRGPFRPLALTGEQEENLRRDGKWDVLIDAAKQDVRSDCSVPYRWEKLFKVLGNGRRYEEAVQVLNEMETQGFPLPHALVAQADPSFLAARGFRESAHGREFTAREGEIQQILRRAEDNLASMTAQQLPPSPYRHAGACPFECCTYRRWKTRAGVQLMESIDSSTAVIDIPARASVDGITGEVRLEPEPYAVLEDNGVMKAGDVIFFLDNIGEGYVNYWYDGKLNPELGLTEGLHLYTYEDCSSNAARMKRICSLKKLYPERTFKSEWWVKIRFQGKVGWVLNTGQFSNVDACG